jgi:hypothetical protein
MSSILRVREGDVLRFEQTFTDYDNDTDQHAVPVRLTVTPLTVLAVVNMSGMAVASRILLKTDKPIYVQLQYVFPLAENFAAFQGPDTQNIRVESLLSLVSKVSQIWITNPSSGGSPQDDAHVELLIVGT